MPRPIEINIEGLNRMVSLLKADTLLAGIWRDAMNEATVAVEAKAKQEAPKATGRLRAAMTHRLQATPVPKWGVVSNDAQANGVRYGFVLQAGHRTRGRPRRVGVRRWRRIAQQTGTWIDLHFASGPREGQSTRGWLNRSLDNMQGRVNQILERAGRKIERRWQSG